VALRHKAQGSMACRGWGESPWGAPRKEENTTMPVVRVILREGQEKPDSPGFSGKIVSD